MYSNLFGSIDGTASMLPRSRDCSMERLEGSNPIKFLSDLILSIPVNLFLYFLPRRGARLIPGKRRPANGFPALIAGEGRPCGFRRCGFNRHFYIRE